MAQKGKICDTLAKTQLQAITALQISDSTKGRVITLQASQIENYRVLDQNWAARQDNLIKTHDLDKAKLKSRLKKRNKIIASQSLVITVLLAILLL